MDRNTIEHWRERLARVKREFKMLDTVELIINTDQLRQCLSENCPEWLSDTFAYICGASADPTHVLMKPAELESLLVYLDRNSNQPEQVNVEPVSSGDAPAERPADMEPAPVSNEDGPAVVEGT